MSYLVFKNYGSVSREELLCKCNTLSDAIGRADTEAETSHWEDLLSVISYAPDASLITHYDVWGCIRDQYVLDTAYRDEQWEY